MDTLRIIVDREWALANIVRNGAHLDQWVCKAVRKDDRSKIDMFESGCRGNRELLIGIVNDLRNVGGVRSTITFGSHVEWLGRVLRETVQEELEEGMNVFAGNGAGTDGFAVVSIGVPDVYGLIQENDVCVGVPAGRIVGGVATLVNDTTRPKFK